MDFPHSSVGKESACNAGDSSSIPGLRRSAEEGIGYPLKYTWASLVAQLVKNPPAMQETWVWSLGREDLLEKEKVAAAKSLQLCPILCNPIDPSPPGSPSLGFSPLRYSGLENSMGCIDHGITKSRTWLSDLHLHYHFTRVLSDKCDDRVSSSQALCRPTLDPHSPPLTPPRGAICRIAHRALSNAQSYLCAPLLQFLG